MTYKLTKREKEIRLVEECEPVDCDYEVPKWWYEEEGER